MRKTFSPGNRVDRYEIKSKIGVGGQGAVFKALDTKLGRTVVIKVLPPELTVKEVNLKRFEREARLASSLDHPNICTIFDLGEAGGLHFITMQHVPGRNVRELVNGRPLDLRASLSIAIQVADALAAAHACGVIHRDVKANNVMVTDGGQVKVLDFGLAKLMEEEERPDGDDVHLTQVGVPYGTATYAAPEQARGDRVDERADIFSTGVLLYEMLTGTWPFHGKTSIDVRHAVLHDTPRPLAEARPEAPPRLQEILDRALAKEPRDRYQRMAELRDDLQAVMREVSPDGAGARPEVIVPIPPPASSSGQGLLARLLGRSSGAAQTSRERTGPTGGGQAVHMTSAEYLVQEVKRHKTGAVVVLALILIAAAGAGFALYKFFGPDASAPARPTPFQAMKITRLTATRKATDAAISPDGRYVVHVVAEGEQQSLWIRQVATTSNVQIVAPVKGRYHGLTFSRDGDFVYFVRDEAGVTVNALYQVPVLGGPATKLLENIDSPITFSPDDKRFAFARRGAGGGEAALMVANADGRGEQKLAARRSPDFFDWPAWSPDGREIACSVTSYQGGFHGEVVSIGAADGKETPLASRRWAEVQRLAWLPDGSGLIMVAQDQPTNPSQIWHLARAGGQAQRITNDLNNYSGVTLTADSAALATVQSEMTVNLWVVEWSWSSISTRQVTSEAASFYDYWGISWSPDGRLVYESTASGNQDIWAMDVLYHNKKQLTTDERQDFDPSVSPDGRYIVFTSLRADATNIWRMNADGSNPVKLTSGKRDFVPSVSPDGRWVIYTNGDSERLTLQRVPIDGGASVQLTDRPALWPAISPDGKQIACWYSEGPSGPQRLAVLPFDGGPPVMTFDVPPTVSTWAEVRWTHDGRALTYIDTRDGVSNIWSQPVGGGPPKQLTDFESDQIFRFAWSRDGKRLACSRGAVANDVILIRDIR